MSSNLDGTIVKSRRFVLRFMMEEEEGREREAGELSLKAHRAVKA